MQPTSNRHYRIYTRTLGNHEVAAQTKREVIARVVARVRHAKTVVEAGKTYSPRFYIRKPEWMPVGKAVGDPRSAFLAENITPEMRAYARELAIERRTAR